MGNIHPVILISKNVKKHNKTSWKTKIIPKKLGEINTGPNNTGNSQGLKNSISETFKTKSPTKQISYDSRMKKLVKSEMHAGKGCHKESVPKSGSIYLKPISKAKERWHLSTSDKPEGTELLYLTPKIQNGDIKGCEGHYKGARLHDKSRLKGRLFFSTTSPGIQKVCEVSMGGGPIRISTPHVWADILSPQGENTEHKRSMPVFTSNKISSDKRPEQLNRQAGSSSSIYSCPTPDKISTEEHVRLLKDSQSKLLRKPHPDTAGETRTAMVDGEHKR